MKKIIKTILIGISGLGLLITTPLFAKPYVQPSFTPHGFYISAGIGENYHTTGIQDAFVDFYKDKHSNPVVVRYFQLEKPEESNFVSSYTLALGYAHFKYPFRLELDYSKLNTMDYKTDKIFSVSQPLPLEFNPSEKETLDNMTIMLVGYLDLIIGNEPIIMPYITAGIGYSSTQRNFLFKDKIVVTPSTTYILNSNIRENYKGIAYQAGIGSRFRITNNLYADLRIQYAFLDKERLVESGFTTSPDPGAPHKYRVNIKTKPLTTIQGILSLTYFFGDQSEPGPSLINDDV